ncbi:restriction endonuclease subunit S [Pauljensenia sp. UMB0895]|uniref:restriction endonuclease subunit S n=2 Tax=Actinomycetaceae TaxID=2049 RepID=UPI00254D897B|nr:restriction endonuclease subunit S [Pauljensenia sp. UMB0895]MDK7337571.1 restriction endonuclease subunit S [Pauljensenia sp. UMB0895]
MSNVESRKPKIRFKGFTDPWEQRKFSEIAHRSSNASSDPTLLNVEYDDIVSGQGILNKDLNDKAGGKSGLLFEPGDVLYGKLRPYLQNWLLPAFTGIAVGDWWVLKPDEVTSNYLYTMVKSEAFSTVANVSAGSKMPRADWSLISETEFSIPASSNEQEAIGSFFSRLDSLITLHQRKLTALKKVKKSLLEKMFPKPGEFVPEIRFKGFTDPWEQRKLGELYEKNDERNTVGFGADRTLSIATMTLNDEGNGAAEESLPNYKVIRVGDVAFEGHTNKEFAYGRFVVNDLIDGIMSPRFTCLRPKHGYPVSLWKYYIHSEQVMREMLVRATKSGTMMNELVLEDLFKQPILVPPSSEQELIGSFFSRLDSLITLHQRKLTALKNVKKSLLEKMFV